MSGWEWLVLAVLATLMVMCVLGFIYMMWFFMSLVFNALFALGGHPLDRREWDDDDALDSQPHKSRRRRRPRHGT